MNLLLLEDKDFTGPDQARIDGRRYMHLKKVLRAAAGSEVACGKRNGKMGRGIITDMAKTHADLTLCLDQDPPAPLPLTLVLALPRPKMLKRTLQAVASLGVKEIYLINSWRVEKSFWSTDLLEPEKLDAHLMLGLEQARDTLMPRVHLKRFFTAFVKEELAVLARDRICILAHPKTDKLCPVGVNSDTVLVIGPEGGFIDLRCQYWKIRRIIPTL